MFSNMILKITNCVYWDFLSTLSAMILGIIFTWLFSKHYYSRGNEYFRRLNLLYSDKLSKIGLGKFQIVHDKKGMPIKIDYVSSSGKLNMVGNLKKRKIKADDKGN